MNCGNINFMDAKSRLVLPFAAYVSFFFQLNICVYVRFLASVVNQVWSGFPGNPVWNVQVTHSL